MRRHLKLTSLDIEEISDKGGPDFLQNRKVRFRESYKYFSEKEKNHKGFTLEDLAEATGWKTATIKAYLTKKWDRFLRKRHNLYYVDGVVKITEEVYLRLMSQNDRESNDPHKPLLPLEVERLVVKAREAATLALDIYNRPATTFRTEGFTVMMIIAWTALFHAMFERSRINYFYIKEDGTPMKIDGDLKAWELARCLSEFFGASVTPLRKNLDFFIELRNKVEHRYVPSIDTHVGGECQALLLNFDEMLTNEFGDFFALREFLSVPLQTSTLRSVGQIEALKRFQGKQYDDLKDYIDAFRAELPDGFYEDPKFSFRVFLIPKIGNHENTSDLAVEFIKYDPENHESFEEFRKQIALIRETKVPVVNPGKYKPTSVAAEVARKTGRAFTLTNHTQAWKMYKVRQSGETPEMCKTEYCQFDEVHKDYIYTQQWIDFLVMKMSDGKEYKLLLAFRPKEVCK